MIINPKYKIGQIVFLLTDQYQLPRVVSAYIVSPSGLLYELSQSTETSNHFDFEISHKENILLSIKHN